VNLFAREPVRAAVYSVVVAVLALLVTLGVVDDATSASIAALVSSVLAVATEVARANVTPTKENRP